MEATIERGKNGVKRYFGSRIDKIWNNEILEREVNFVTFSVM